MTPLPEVTLYVDGSCPLNKNNPQRYYGGWAYIICYGAKERSGTGHAFPSTNQTMELEAAIQGLKALLVPAKVLLISDSRYVVDGMADWMWGWEKNGWRTGEDTRVKNQPQWAQLLKLCRLHTVKTMWVKGHSTKQTTHHRYNNLCDEMARDARVTGWKLRNQLTTEPNSVE